MKRKFFYVLMFSISLFATMFTVSCHADQKVKEPQILMKSTKNSSPATIGKIIKTENAAGNYPAKKTTNKPHKNPRYIWRSLKMIKKLFDAIKVYL